MFFRFGRVWTVTGYRFTKGSDAVLSKGDNLQKMFKVLGKPRDAGPGQYLYRCDQVRILIETENGKVTTVTLE